jgi:N utilization substance protein A
LLASEGYNSVQEIADSTIAEVASIEGLDESIAEELINRAKEYAKTHADAATNPSLIVSAKSKVHQDVLELNNMNDELAAQLYNAGIKSLADIADLDREEFVEKAGDTGLTSDVIDSIIMAAREKVYFSK